MRLINTDTLQLEDFFTRSVPEYAILSHTWGPDEVTYQQFISPERQEVVRKAGYNKIRGACEVARSRQFQYIWIDSCCIDKTSSAELTESINSMFRWYEEASICFAFLEDVPSRPIRHGTANLGHESRLWYSAFEASRWFTRGWTLQELLAPRQVEFMSSVWELIGTRDGEGEHIAKITGIAKEYLADIPTVSHLHSVYASFERRSDMLKTANVAQRMSWASDRTTTRPEDIAYCLLGLFGVNMPLIYGEGANAFMRLQEEIARISSDFTLLAWNLSSIEGGADDLLWPENKTTPHRSPFAIAKQMWELDGHPWCASPAQPRETVVHPGGCLAPHPSYFRGCQSLCTSKSLGEGSTSWKLGSSTLTIKAPLSENSRPYFVLPCYPKNDPSRFLSIPLSPATHDLFARSWLPARYVPSQTWHRWPRKHLVFSTRGNHASHLAPKERAMHEIVWLRSIPPSIRLEGLSLVDGVWMVGDRLLHVPTAIMRDPAAPIVALKLHATDLDNASGESFGVVLRAPAVQGVPTEQAWKKGRDSFGFWPWNIDEPFTQFPDHAFLPPNFAQPSAWPGFQHRYQLDKTPKDLRLRRHHVSVTVSLDHLRDRRIFTVDIHRRHPLIGSNSWKLAHSWMPTAFHTFQDALVGLLASYGWIIQIQVLKAVMSPNLQVLRHYWLEMFCLALVAHLTGPFAGYLIREYTQDDYPICRAWLHLNNGSRLIIHIPQWFAMPIYIYHVLPLFSVYFPSSSDHLRQIRWPIAALLGLLFRCVAPPGNFWVVIYAACWRAADTWQLGWWHCLGIKSSVPSYAVLQISYSFFVTLARIFFRGARDALDLDCKIISSEEFCKVYQEYGRPMSMIDWLRDEISWLATAGSFLILDWWAQLERRDLEGGVIRNIATELAIMFLFMLGS